MFAGFATSIMGNNLGKDSVEIVYLNRDIIKILGTPKLKNRPRSTNICLSTMFNEDTNSYALEPQEIYNRDALNGCISCKNSQ